MALASVSGVACSWVCQAILIEGRERSPAPLVQKPLYSIPHHVLMLPKDLGVEVLYNDKRERGEMEMAPCAGGFLNGQMASSNTL